MARWSPRLPGLAVQADDPFTVGGVGLAVRGGPRVYGLLGGCGAVARPAGEGVCRASDHQSHSTRHTRVLKDATRLASVQMGYNEPLYGVTAAVTAHTLPHTLAAGWDRLWGAVHAVQAVLVCIDSDQPGCGVAGYGPNEIGAFMGAIKGELGGPRGRGLVGHTGKASAKADEPSALDILGSGGVEGSRALRVDRPTSGNQTNCT